MTTQQVQSFDEAKAEAFAGKMLGIVNDACLGFLLSIGHNTGLLDKMATLKPSTSDEIAAAAGLNERYVREWLGGMTLGSIIEYDAVAGTYHLPAEHAPFVTRAGGADNIAVFAQYLHLLGLVESQVTDAFRNGGGVPASAYPRFQELQALETGPVFEATLIDATLPLVPGIMDRLREGIDVLDVGCGQGRAINLMAKAFPNSRFTGYDVSAEGVAAARSEADDWKLTNARFEVQDMAQTPVSEQSDLITAFDVIHDLAKPREVLAAIHRALKPGGAFMMAEFAGSSRLEENHEHPLGPTLFAFSVFYCMTTSLADGGEGLGTLWGEQKARAYLAEAGFSDVEIRAPEGELIHAYYVCRK